MNRGVSWIVTTVLICLTLSLSASAMYMVSYWLNGSVQATLLERNVSRPVRRCNYETVLGDNLAPSQSMCVTKTSWGSIASDGRIKVGSEGLYHALTLSASQTLLTDVGYTDRLYVSVAVSGGYTIGYYENAKTALQYQLGSKAYTVRGSLHIVTIPGTDSPFVFSSSGFSNNGEWLVGTYSGQMMRIDLMNGKALRFPVSSLDDSNAIFTPTISNDGGYIALAGANFWKLELYDMMYCTYGHESDAWYDSPLCESKRLLSDEEIKGQYPSNPQFADDGLSLRYNAVANGQVNEMLLWAGSPTGMVAGGMGVDYVALGDSYSSGEGDAGHYLSGTDGTNDYPKEKCHVSTTSYSARLSSQFGGEYFSVACSGAVMNNVVFPTGLSYDGQFGQIRSLDAKDPYRQVWHDDALLTHTPGRIAQVDFVGQYHPKVVTMTIGGNDVEFKDTLVGCIYGFSTCDQVAQNRGEMGKKIKGVYDQLVSTYRGVIQQSPGTKVYIVGYPLFIKEGATQCGWNVGFDGSERRFITEGTKYLNQVVRAAAYAAGAYYVDIENAFGDEALCGPNPDAMNGISLGDDIAPALGFKFVGQESFHPTARGHELMAQAITKQIGSLESYHDSQCSDAASTYSCHSSEGANPVMPAYFASALSSSDPDYVVSGQMSDENTQSADSSHTFSLLDALLRPLTIFTLFVRSEPQQLGTYTVDANGLASGSYTLPSNLSSGYHTLVLDGLTPDGQTVRYEQVIYVYNPSLPPANNVCSGVVPVSGVDQDNDGIDDACDGQITVANQQTVYSPYDTTDYGATTTSITTTEPASETPTAQQLAGSRYVTIGDMLLATTEQSTTEDTEQSDNMAKTVPDTSNSSDAQLEGMAKTNTKDWPWLIAVVLAVVIVSVGSGWLFVRWRWKNHR